MRWCYVKHGAGQSCRRNHLISVLSSLGCLIIYRPTGAHRGPSSFLLSSLGILSSLFFSFYLCLYWFFLLPLLPPPVSKSTFLIVSSFSFIFILYLISSQCVSCTRVCTSNLLLNILHYSTSDIELLIFVCVISQYLSSIMSWIFCIAGLFDAKVVISFLAL